MKIPDEVIESYPPQFRPSKNPTHDPIEPPSNDEDPIKCIPTLDDNSDPIPIIDLQSTDIDNQIDEACKNWGVFRVVNHGIPTTLVEQLHEHSRKILFLPFETKQTLFNSPLLSYFYGSPALTPSGSALPTGPKNDNWVDGVNGRQIGKISQIHQIEDPILVDFRLLFEEYGRHITRLASTLFEVMAKNLKLDSEKFSSYLSESTGILRLYRYLLCSDYNRKWGMRSHTDNSVLTILNQDEVGGLQILKDDKWSDVEPISNTFIVNVGDMMQAMSNDEYKSVIHRVKMNLREERISLVYFVFPTDDVIIESSKYKPFSYADFFAQVREDINATGFKVGLDRFKLT